MCSSELSIFVWYQPNLSHIVEPKPCFRNQIMTEVGWPVVLQFSPFSLLTRALFSIPLVKLQETNILVDKLVLYEQQISDLCLDS